MINKTLLGILILIVNVISIVVIIQSAGWILLMSSVVIIPTFIYNAIISIWGNNVLTKRRLKILIPNLLLLIYAITRIDMDDYSAYTGFSSTMSMLGLRESIYVEASSYFNQLLFFNVLTIAGVLIYNSCVWYNLRKPHLDN